MNDNPDDPKPTYTKATSEPAMVRFLGEQWFGGNPDNARAARLYRDLKWQIKKASMISTVTIEQLDAIIADSQNKIRAEIKTESMREQIIAKFQQMRDRLATLEGEVGAAQREGLCPTCQLPIFICPCKKES